MESAAIVQETVTIDETQAIFLQHVKAYGLADKNALMQEALRRMEADLEEKALAESGRLYAEVYEEDADLQALTEAAWTEFPANGFVRGIEIIERGDWSILSA